MALPTPDLDDRRFQQLVDDAKRMVMARCPTWTDHNVSDPGVTLIETFAYMTDVLLYRLNRVPDRLYLKFLELIGLQLFPATSARTGVTFYLSSPAQATLTLPRGTRAATLRTETQDPVVFTTVEDLPIVACSLGSVLTAAVSAEGREERTEQLRLRVPFAAFSNPPEPGDALLVGLTEAVPRCAVRLQFHCTIEGVGVDPDDPPLQWEAYDGTTWHACDVGEDGTGGLNRDGSMIIHVPRQHSATLLDGERAGWLRARVVAAAEGQPSYSASPMIHGLVADTIGGTADAAHADIIEHETLGVSEGVAGETFKTAYAPVLPAGDALRLLVTSDEGWTEWHQVEHFAASSATDNHFVLDAVHGVISFGPGVREADGSLRQYGAVAPKGAIVQLDAYATGGGRVGNVGAGSIRTLKSSIPFVAGVENRIPAIGGVDGEDLESAKTRGPILLRTRNRAVTAEDFEQLTRAAAPEVARVKCLPAGDGAEAGCVRILIVPAAPIVDGQIRFEHLVPSEETMARILNALDSARLVGTRVIIEPPVYQGVTVVAQVKAKPKISVVRVREEASAVLHRYFNPLVGGPDGHGWPWGRPIQSGEAYTALQEIRGVDFVEEIRLFGANPVTGERGQATTRLELAASAIAFSYEHQIRVVEP
ncbi:MAG: putative baseplate assembly protein [Actinomycetota bacterium]|nr:putative baseplate assembly protein [Actinomycetota bacterium]